MENETIANIESKPQASATRKTVIDATGAQYVCNQRGKWARTCGAKTRAGSPCQCVALGRGRRCKWHGGRSTGARTPEGKARSLAALFEGNAAWRAQHRKG